MDTFNFDTYDYKRWLIFCWPTGTGKTYTAESIIERFNRELEESNKNDHVRYYFWWVIMTDWKFKQLVKSNSLKLRSPAERETPLKNFPLEVIIKCKLLLYDDIWVSDASDAYIRDLTFVLDERISKWLVTIFTTNLSKDELSEKLNERIVSRMLLNSDIIMFVGDDRRLQNTKVYSALLEYVPN